MVFVLSFLSFVTGFLYGRINLNKDAEEFDYDFNGIHDDTASHYISELVAVVKRYIPGFKIKMGAVDFIKYGRFLNEEDVVPFEGSLYVPDPDELYFLPEDRLN